MFGSVHTHEEQHPRCRRCRFQVRGTVPASRHQGVTLVTRPLSLAPTRCSPDPTKAQSVESGAPSFGRRSTASWPPELHFPTVNVRLQQGNALSHTPPGLGKFMVNSAGWFSHRLPQRSQLRGYQSTASFSTGEPRMKSNPSHHQYGCSCTLDF